MTTYIVLSGTSETNIIGRADTLEAALFIRGPKEGPYFNNRIYKLLDVTVVEESEQSNV